MRNFRFIIMIMAAAAMMLQSPSSGAGGGNIVKEAERRMKEVVTGVKSDYRNIPVMPRVSSGDKGDREKKERISRARALVERAKSEISNIARQYIGSAAKKVKTGSEISEDESKRTADEIQKMTDKYIDELNKLLEQKEKEILEV